VPAYLLASDGRAAPRSVLCARASAGRTVSIGLHALPGTGRDDQRPRISASDLYERCLLDLVTRESQDRQQKRIQRLRRQSRIPAEKALANFNLKRLPPKVAILTKSLVEGGVLDRRENVLAFGNPGSGKTHLLCAIGQELIARGRRMYFTTSALLVQDLLVAKRDLNLSRFVKKLAHLEGLIIDDLGTCSRAGKR
jgi:DNA replication protein DnaC